MDLGVMINKYVLHGLGKEGFMSGVAKVDTYQDLQGLAPWEKLLKELLWRQIGDVRGKRILDFGSGLGVTANHYARYNHVVAIEPCLERIEKRVTEQEYEQMEGGLDALKKLPSDYYDVVFCHNVLEYASERAEIVAELQRVLRPGGFLSLVKHNRAGRVMQMAVLLDDFERANALLDGKGSMTSQYGAIDYYEDEDVLIWGDKLGLERNFGIRTFWDLQQNQEKHSTEEWQENMLRLEQRVAEKEEYRAIAFFHHLILRK